MFCPECRRYWTAPQDSASSESSAQEGGNAPSSKFGKRRSRPVRCGDCGAPLANDRLVAEFPDPEKQTQQAGRNATEPRITIQDILRETAGHSPLAGFNSMPQERRVPRSDQQQGEGPYTRSGYRSWREPHPDDEWDRTDSPMIPADFGRSSSRFTMLDIVLGLGALCAIAVLIVSIVVRTVFTPQYGLEPKATVVSAASLGALTHGMPDPAIRSHNRPSLDLDSLMPGKIGNAWARQKKPSVLSQDASSGSATIAGSYRSRAGSVRVWVERLRSDADALARLNALTVQRQAFQSAGAHSISFRRETFAGKPSSVLDSNSGSGGTSVSSAPGVTLPSHLRSWLQGSYVITVTSDSAANRDNFAQGYISTARS